MRRTTARMTARLIHFRAMSALLWGRSGAGEEPLFQVSRVVLVHEGEAALGEDRLGVEDVDRPGKAGLVLVLLDSQVLLGRLDVRPGRSGLAQRLREVAPGLVHPDVEGPRLSLLH